MRCTTEPNCPASSHYSNCRSMPSTPLQQAAPGRIFLQLSPRSEAVFAETAWDRDPREIHDNGEPVYDYVPASLLSSHNTQIREVLEGLSSVRYYDHGQPERCWCDADDVETPHMPACLAARELWERVQS